MTIPEGPAAKKPRIEEIKLARNIGQVRNSLLQSLPMLAAARGNWKLMAQLLATDISQLHRQYDVNGRNLLHYCAVRPDGWVGLAVMANMLLKLAVNRKLQICTNRGTLAAILMPDNQRMSPAQLAVQLDNLEFVQLLSVLTRELGEVVHFDALDAVRHGALRVGKWLRLRGHTNNLYHRQGESCSGQLPGMAETSGQCHRQLSELKELPGWGAEEPMDEEEQCPPVYTSCLPSHVATSVSHQLLASNSVSAFVSKLRPHCPARLLPMMNLLPLTQDPVSAAVDFVSEEEPVLAALQQIGLLL